MSEHPGSWLFSLGFGAVLGSLLVGSLLGLIPLVAGQVTSQVRVGRVAFLTTVGAAFLAGALLALPCCLGFTLKIYLGWRRSKREAKAIAGAHDA